MNIFYTNETLYINIDSPIDEYLIKVLKKRLYNIINDYDIDNIVLTVIKEFKTSPLILELVNEYHNKFHGKLVVR